jgi:hypothetical protein
VPEKIVLYLDSYEFPENARRSLTKVLRLGVDIRFVRPGLASYKKLIPALGDFPAMAIVTCDDDMFFDEGWFAALAAMAADYPGVIVSTRGRQVRVDAMGAFAPYSEWSLAGRTEPGFRLASLGGCGTWYPPGSLDTRVTDASLFLRLAPHADDLWFSAMAWLAKTPICNVGLIAPIAEIAFAVDRRLWHLNSEGGNDRQFAAIADHFGLTPQRIAELEASLGVTYSLMSKTRDLDKET